VSNVILSTVVTVAIGGILCCSFVTYVVHACKHLHPIIRM